MHFGAVRRSGDVVLQVDGLRKGYDRPLIEDLSFSLRRGQRLGIMGPTAAARRPYCACCWGKKQPMQARCNAATWSSSATTISSLPRFLRTKP